MHQITRRAALTLVAAVAFLPRATGAVLAPSLGDKRFVLVILRGGLDGLAAIPPYGDRDYRRTRGTLALARPGEPRGVVDLDGFFGLHPALSPLYEFYAKGELLLLPATATGCRVRSHAVGQRVLESGTTQLTGAVDGWLGRALCMTQVDGRPIALAACREVPMLLRPISVLHKAPRAVVGFDSAALDLMADLSYGNSNFAKVLATAGRGVTAFDALSDHAAAFRQTAEDVGHLLASDEGPRVAVLESHGWDTHSDQGRSDGRLAIAFAGLASGLVALATSCGEAWQRTVVLVATEFGRTVTANATDGTDHGAASTAFLLGGAVDGGRVLGKWPGLSADRLYRGSDLMPTGDLRSIAKAVLMEHLGLSRVALDESVFPDSAAIEPQLGLLRTKI